MALNALPCICKAWKTFYDLMWTTTPAGDTLTYGDVYHQNEVEQSTYNFEYSDAAWLLEQFNGFEAQAKRLLALEDASLALPAYELVLKAGHTFNLLDARGAISVTERATYIGRIRALSRQVAQKFVASREALGYPLLNRAIMLARTKQTARKPQGSLKTIMRE